MDDEKECARQCEQIWRDQCLPKFVEAKMGAAQIDAAHKMFKAGFETGWQSHQATLAQEFIRDSQRKKVHLA